MRVEDDLVVCLCARTTGSSVCIDCEAGKFKASAGATACENCVAGKYKAAAGINTACDSCQAGKYSPTAGALAFIVLVCILFWCIASVHALMGCCIRDDSHVWSWQKTPRGAPSCLETMTPGGLSSAMIPK